MTFQFYTYNENKFYTRIGLEIFGLVSCAIVTMIGLFILTNKNLSRHPYPMIAYAIIASGAYMASFSKSYWIINGYFYFNSPSKESWIISMFSKTWFYLLRLMD